MPQKRPVTPDALAKRINRKRRQDDEPLRCCRPNSRFSGELGRYDVVDQNRNAIVSKHVDLEELGQELGVLRPYEELSD